MHLTDRLTCSSRSDLSCPVYTDISCQVPSTLPPDTAIFVTDRLTCVEVPWYQRKLDSFSYIARSDLSCPVYTDIWCQVPSTLTYLRVVALFSLVLAFFTLLIVVFVVFLGFVIFDISVSSDTHSHRGTCRWYMCAALITSGHELVGYNDVSMTCVCDWRALRMSLNGRTSVSFSVYIRTYSRENCHVTHVSVYTTVHCCYSGWLDKIDQT